MVPKNSSSSIAEDKKLLRNGYRSTPAVDPRDGQMWEVLISNAKITDIAKYSSGKALELGYCVTQILETPRAVFKGVREMDEDDWWCYAGTPDHAYDYKTAEKRPSWPLKVMAIFVTDDRVLYNWYWCEVDQEVPYLPKDFKTRFREKVF